MVIVMTEERWAELYRLEFPRIYRALLAVLRDRERALDALHDAFVAGLRHPPAHDADLAGWLFVVAVRSTRRFRRLPFLPLEWVTGSSGDDEIEAALDRMEVGRLLAGLTERQRAMVVAQFYLGLDHREIDRHFGVKTGSFCRRIGASPPRVAAAHRRALSWTMLSSPARPPTNGRTWSGSTSSFRGIWSSRCTNGEACWPWIGRESTGAG